MKKSIIVRNKKRDVIIPTKILILRQIYKTKLTFNEKVKLFIILNKSCLRIRNKKRNRCFITGRARSFSRFFGLGRHSIKDFIANLKLPGLFKSSW